ncbi:MAG: hypothetical protein II235_05860 [Muribaculaceae bacterium]|nr:hypothetical protein [Muribaculaceae bacterium]
MLRETTTFKKKHIHDNRHNAYAIAWVVFVRICKYVVVLSEREKPIHASFIVKRDSINRNI